MSKAYLSELIAITFIASVVVGSTGAAIGYKFGIDKGVLNERNQTRVFVNRNMAKAGFCRAAILGTLVQQCLDDPLGLKDD